MGMDELIANFSIEKIQPSPAIANLERLDWLNGQFIRRLPPDELARRIAPRVPGASVESLEPLIPLVQERLRTLNEAPDMLRFFFEEPADYRPEQLIPKGRDSAAVNAALSRAASSLGEVNSWNAESIESTLRPLAEQLGWSSRDLFMLLRVAITGRTVTPPLIESMARLPKDAVIRRIERAATRLPPRAA
jgi:glutamyl-tRNA synthetase